MISRLILKNGPSLIYSHSIEQHFWLKFKRFPGLLQIHFSFVITQVYIFMETFLLLMLLMLLVINITNY